MNKDLILREKLALQRTVLANQSTFLAFLRTAMYFLVAGLTINNLLDLVVTKLVRFLLIPPFKTSEIKFWAIIAKWPLEV